MVYIYEYFFSEHFSYILTYMLYINITQSILKVHLHCRLERQQRTITARTVLEGWIISCASAYSLFPFHINFYVEVKNHFGSNSQFISQKLLSSCLELEVVA